MKYLKSYLLVGAVVLFTSTSQAFDCTWEQIKTEIKAELTHAIGPRIANLQISYGSKTYDDIVFFYFVSFKSLYSEYQYLGEVGIDLEKCKAIGAHRLSLIEDVP